MLELLAARGSLRTALSSTIWSDVFIKLLLLFEGLLGAAAAAASTQGAFSCDSEASDAPAVVLLISSWVSASFAYLMTNALVKYLKQKVINQRKYITS